MNDSFYIEVIIRKIEKQLGWKKVSLWTDNEYKKLSHLIYKDTTISISPQTLKRLFGKVKYKEEYTPQPATRDALVRFLKYDDWEAFVKEQSDSKFDINGYFRKWFPVRNRNQLVIPGILILVAALAIIYAPHGNESKAVTFNAENLSGVTPHTVSFHYDISDLKDREVYIDFDHKEAEDKSPGELLDKSRRLINHCYESPGFFKVSISSEGIVLGTAKVHVLSDGWVSYYFNDDNFMLRKFVFGLEQKVRDTIDNGLLYISPKELSNQGFNGNTVYYLEHMLYKDFQASADSSTLEVRYENNPAMGGISCYDAEFRIIGESGLASVMLVQKGCYRWSEITVGEKHLNGKFDDLSSFSTDLSSWNVLRIKIRNGRATITNGNDTIYVCDYARKLGRVKGLRLLTKGSGAFEYVRLFNDSGQVVYDGNFGD